MKAISISKSITNRSEINDYLKDVAKIPLLTKEEEIDLATKARNGDKKAKDKLIISNLRFVITVAKKYQNNGLPLADLINEGNIGLIRAAELFDPNKGFKFISYAVWWIRQAIVKAIQNTNRTIRIPSTQYSILYNINKEISNFYQKNERQPSAEELSIIMNIPEEQIIKLLEYNNRMSSIDTPISDDEDAGTMVDIIPNQNIKKTDYSLNEESDNTNMNLILNLLGDRERDIVILYYGLGCKALRLGEIGRLFGISAERTRQVRDKALNKLRTTYKKQVSHILYGSN